MMAVQIQPQSSVAANDDAAAVLLGDLHGFHRIGGDAAVMLPQAVQAWVEQAEANARRPYAFGHLPTWSKGPKLMRELSAQGFVELTCDRSQAPKAYLARRTAKPWPVMQVKPKKVARAVACYDTQLVELMHLVREWTEAEAPVPSNEEIRLELGLGREVKIAYLLGVLERAGQIRRTVLDGAPYRQITDVKSGKSTAGGPVVLDGQGRGEGGRFA